MRVDPNYVKNLSYSLDASAQRQADLSAELSSGLRVSNLSTDPNITSQSTLLNTAISQQDSFIQVATTETGRLQVQDSTLGEAVTQLTSAISLATQAANGTLNTGNLSAIQQKVIGIRDSVLSLANTAYTGTYLFAGSQGTTQPFTLDTSTNPATFTYNGDTKTQSIVTPGGQTIQVGLPGSDVFGAVLTALNVLISDLGSASATGVTVTNQAASGDAATLTSALTQLTNQRTVLGNGLARVQATSAYAQTQEANLKIQQSNLVSADTSQVATNISSASTQHQALLNVIAALSKNTLFDYIQ